MIKFLHGKMVTRNQLIAMLAIAGLVSTIAATAVIPSAFAYRHLHIWLPHGGSAWIWGSGSAPNLDIRCGTGFGWSAYVQC
jgi:hypothetical protein